MAQLILSDIYKKNDHLESFHHTGAFMNNFFLIVVLLFSMNINVAKSEVWHSTNKWNHYWENEYRDWINDNLSINVFKKDSGILSGISTDCADALYDVRIQFAYEHSLPFVINAPDSLRSQMRIFGSDTSMFDSIKDERSRVRAFINYINDEVGTENLAKDTFPVKIKDIDSGIVYFVEWWLFGKDEHHSYIVKGFDQNNELLYYASDAPRKVRKLQIDRKYPRFSFSSSPYGFRKWRLPEYLLVPEKEIPEEEGYSNEQYKILERVGKRGVLKEIRRQYQR